MAAWHPYLLKLGDNMVYAKSVKFLFEYSITLFDHCMPYTVGYAMAQLTWAYLNIERCITCVWKSGDGSMPATAPSAHCVVLFPVFHLRKDRGMGGSVSGR